MKHFKLRTDLKKELFEVTLFQIEATIEGKWGPKGTLGGFIEKESNLNDNAWVSGNAQVSGEAQVSGNALVSGQARVEKYGQCIVINNLKNIITCMPNRIQIGCKDFPTLDKFEETYKQIAKENNYTAEEAEQTANFVRIAMKNMIPIQKSVKVSYNG